MGIPPPTAEELVEASPYRELTQSIVGAAIEVHRELGPGLTEAPYREALARELVSRGHVVRVEVFVPVFYKGAPLRAHYRLDILVDETVVVETKAVERLADVHRAQALSHLRATGLPVGLVLNFSGRTLREGIARIANF